MSEIIDMGINLGLIEKSGSWFTVNGERMQGKDNVKQYMKEHPELAEQYQEEIMKNAFKLMSPQSKAAAVAAGRAVDVSADDFDG